MKTNKCYWCGVNNIKHLDHFLPKSFGGKIHNNIVGSCAKCNQQKQNKIWIKTSDGLVLKPKNTPKKFIKVIEQDKYFITSLSFISIVPKLNKRKAKYPIPKVLDYSQFGDEIKVEELVVKRIRVKEDATPTFSKSK